MTKFEFELPDRPEPISDPHLYRALVRTTVAKAISAGKPVLVFPSRQAVATRFAIEPAEAGVMIRELVETGHLSRLGTEYFTAHPAVTDQNEQR